MLLSSAAALDREAFTVTHYDLSVRLEPSQQRLGVRGRITLRNDSSQPQRVAALQISSSLSWRSIRAVSDSKSQPHPQQTDLPDSGQPLQFVSQPYTSDIDHTGELSEAIVTLPRELAPKESIDLAIGYEGVIVLDATRLTRIGTPETVARHSDWDQIGKTFTSVRGIGYVTWYPVALEAQNLSEGNAMFAALGKWKKRHAASSMELRVELVFSGASEKPVLLVNGKGCAIVEGAVGGAVALSGCKFDALGFANPTLVVGDLKETVAGPVRLHYLSEHTGAAEEFAKAENSAASLVKEWFGTPRDNLDVVELADSDAAPFEAGDWLLLPLARNDPKLAQTLLVHQLTHAAFPSSRLWIYEGATHFAQALACEQQNGREAALEYLGMHRAAVVQAETPPGAAGEALAQTTQEVLYRSKAALVWWMLRDMVGDAALKRAIREYQPGQDENPSYFQHLLEIQSKRDLGWFFQDWVYTDAELPDFRVASANTRSTTGANFVTAVTIENAGAAGAEVLVTIRTDSGDFPQHLEVRGKSKAVLRISTPAEPREVIVNDGSVPESDIGNNHLKIAKDETPK